MRRFLFIPTHRDARLIFLIAILRAFTFGFISVSLALFLAARGFSTLQIGLTLSATLAGEALVTLLGGLFADRLGRRRFLAIVALAASVGSVLFAFAGSFAVSFAIGLCGVVSSRGKDRGAMTAVEQAMLPETVADKDRTPMFASYNFLTVLAGAAGALFVGGIGLVQRSMGFPLFQAYQGLFLLYALISVIAALLYLRVSPVVEPAPARQPQPKRQLLPRIRSWKVIGGLSALFALDSFGGGMIIQSFLAYWFNQHYGMSLTTLGTLFFAANILSALSFPVAAWLASRIGLINTMVFTHIPSNLFMAAIPFAPTAWLAMTLYLMRESLAQMDIPTRQSYTVSIVPPQERTAMVTSTVLARNAAQITSPTIAGFIIQMSIYAPFLIGGAVKITYDILLYFAFRRIKPPEEQQGNHAAPVGEKKQP